jgi:hypothetical protein
MNIRSIALLSLLCMPMLALANGPGAVRKQIESSMVVTGEVEITEAGQVAVVELDEPAKLPPGIVDFVHGQVSQWTFEPVVREGRAVPARSRMSVRVVGKRIDNDAATITIRNAAFPGPEPREGEAVASVAMRPPGYPEWAARGGAQGTAYLVLKIGRDGKVIDAIAEQVNLKVVASEQSMAKLRALFADSSLAAARSWTFRPPTVGEEAEAEYWSVRVPVDYTLHNAKRRPGYGRWEAYVPGPRQTIPWADESESPGFSPDALADGGLYMAGASETLRLLTSLEEG